MLTLEFLRLLKTGFEMSPYIVGQLFTYSPDTHKFSVVYKKKTAQYFQIRWLFALFISVALLLLTFRSQKGSLVSGLGKAAETNMGLLTSDIVYLASEGFRIRLRYSHEFIAFLNGAIQLEMKLTKGSPKN